MTSEWFECVEIGIWHSAGRSVLRDHTHECASYSLLICAPLGSLLLTSDVS